MIVGQGPTALPSLWETARYRLKFCLKGPLNLKQPTNRSVTCNTSFIIKSSSQGVLEQKKILYASDYFD